MTRDEKPFDPSDRLRGRFNIEAPDDLDDFDLPPSFPRLDPLALRGIAGEFVSIARYHTEADDAALLFSFLTACGCFLGGDPKAPMKWIGPDKHHARLFSVLVGQSGRGRKGASWGPVERFIEALDKLWQVELACDGEPVPPEKSAPDTAAIIRNPFPPNVIYDGGLSSGEGIIDQIRDQRELAFRTKDNLPVIDDGNPDKRLLVVESEFGNVLRMQRREGSSLSVIIRNAWDGKRLAPLIRHNRISATRPHLSIIGHITRHELLMLLDSASFFNGFANRMLWVAVHRARKLPDPPPLSTDELRPIATEFMRVWNFARGRIFNFTHDAREQWREVYSALGNRGHNGLLAALLTRADAYAVRLAMLFACLDGAEMIEPAHIDAAMACSRYVEQSAEYIFGDRSADLDADKLLFLLGENNGELDGRGIKAKGKGHFTGDMLARLARDLTDRGLVTVNKIDTGGRPRTVWRLTPAGLDWCKRRAK